MFIDAKNFAKKYKTQLRKDYDEKRFKKSEVISVVYTYRQSH